jgi:hypothetical protein
MKIKAVFAILMAMFVANLTVSSEQPPVVFPPDLVIYVDWDGDGVVDDPELDFYIGSSPIGVPVDVQPGVDGGETSIVNIHIGSGYTIQDLVSIAIVESDGDSRIYKTLIKGIAIDLQNRGFISPAQAREMRKKALPSRSN